jgi:hypothetical protein
MNLRLDMLKAKVFYYIKVGDLQVINFRKKTFDSVEFILKLSPTFFIFFLSAHSFFLKVISLLFLNFHISLSDISIPMIRCKPSCASMNTSCILNLILEL